MKIHKRLIVLVGLGMLLVMTITVLSLQDITAAFTHTLKGMGQISSEFNRIWDVEKNIKDMALAAHNYAESGDSRYQASFDTSSHDADRTLGELGSIRDSDQEKTILASLTSELERMKLVAGRIFSLTPPGGRKMPAERLLAELDVIVLSAENTIGKYESVNAGQMDAILADIHREKVRTNILFLIILFTSVTFLFFFGVYLHRKVSVPLNELWEGTEEISRGNLDFQMRTHDQGDIAQLGGRFNEMTLRLKESYADLEQKLLDRTHALAALDDVALTLSQAGTLKDVLDKSLGKILDSLAGIQPKGGVFLCDQTGESLSLVSHRGLPADFVQREAMIKMGECLCGMVAQSGELLYTQNSCEDTRHTRLPGEESHSHIIIPMKSRGIVLGVIFLYPQKDFALKPSDVQMLDAVGAQLGMAVENFRFYAEVKESSEKFWDLFENARDILFTIDAAGRLTAVNKEAELFSGFSKVELSGKDVSDFLTPEGTERARNMLAGRVASGQWAETEVIKRDGSRAFLDVSVRKIIKDRKPVGFQVSARDVTEQKNLREMLVKAERLGAIGQVGIAVRHEINNPLTTVVGNIELLLERYGDKDRELTARLNTVLDSALRIAEIVKRLQAIKEEKVVDYLKGVKMTDLKQG